MATKKTRKKSPSKRVAKKKSVKKAPPKKRRSFVWLYIVVGLVIIGALAFLLYTTLQGNNLGGDVLVTVNGEPIYADSIDVQYDRLPAELQETVTKDDLVDQTIEKMLVIQHATADGVSASEEEVGARIEGLASAFGISIIQLKELLEQQNVTYEEYADAIREEIILNKFVEEEILLRVDLSEEHLEEWYQDNIDRYTGEEGQSRIRHVLLENESEAWDVYDLAVNSERLFSDLAVEYSIGPSGPRGGDLGYVDESTSFVPEFLEVALTLEEGEISDPVESEFGWHVIMRDTDVVPYEDAREEVDELARQEEAQDQFQFLIRQLKEEADIVYAE